MSNVADRASELWDDAYDQGERYYRQGSRVVSNMDGGTVALMLLVGTIGYALAWMIHGDQSYSSRNWAGLSRAIDTAITATVLAREGASSAKLRAATKERCTGPLFASRASSRAERGNTVRISASCSPKQLDEEGPLRLCTCCRSSPPRTSPSALLEAPVGRPASERRRGRNDASEPRLSGCVPPAR